MLPRVGPKPLIVIGLVMTTTGMVLLTGIGQDTAYWSHVLPTLVLASMQNLSEDEQAAFANQLKVLADSKLEDWAKSLTLGLTLETLVGRRVLKAAVETLKAAQQPHAPVGTTQTGVTHEG